MLRAVATTLLIAAAAVPPSVAVSHPVVTVHAHEYTFVAPASIAAGTTTFRLVNDGKEIHQMSILRLATGRTLAEYAEAMKANKPVPWATGVGGPNAAGPGETIEATLTLEAGSYVLVCWVASPGGQVPHMAKGMIQPLTVTARGGVSRAGGSVSSLPESAPDVRLELFDYAFRFSKPLVAGKHTIRVTNIGAQEHEAVIVKLAPGKTMRDFRAWAETDMKGPAPAEPAPGMAGLGKGRTGTFTTTLTPGTYGLICWIADAKDGKPHAMHGMVQEFTVAAK